jgi:formate hydrogenlyase subunit 3/multisubunit Na+/H+ antiporter MnhD subunit
MKSIDTIRLRVACGALGMLLPIIVLILCAAFGCAPDGHIFPDSISATYYYDPTVAPFMIILGAAGIMLMCYRGYTWVDDLVNTLTGIAAECICLFPCYNETHEYVGAF